MKYLLLLFIVIGIESYGQKHKKVLQKQDIVQACPFPDTSYMDDCNVVTWHNCVMEETLLNCIHDDIKPDTVFVIVHDDSLTTQRFIGDSVMLEYRYSTDNSHMDVWHSDTSLHHEHYPAIIYLYRYKGNKKWLLGSCRGIYSQKECASDSAIRWYRLILNKK